jgi:hypothetical protein
MLSYWVSLLGMRVYELIELIRNSAPTGVLISIGCLFFALGAVLRHHLPAPGEIAPSQTPIESKGAMLSNPHWKAPGGLASATTSENEQIALVTVMRSGQL